MATPLIRTFDYAFKPLRKTPASNLLRDSGFDKQKGTVNILLLGCSDPGSILYTTWYNDEANFDITACDLQPAILARNILLLCSLVEDTTDEAIRSLWNCFYHLFIPDKDATKLWATVTRLLDASESQMEWGQSAYGKSVQFTCRESMHAVRRIWKGYFRSLSGCRNAQAYQTRVVKSYVWERHEAQFGSEELPMGACAAGVRCDDSVSKFEFAFRAYWNTGVVAGNASDYGELSEVRGGITNPLFAVCSSPLYIYSVSSATEPLAGFHLETAFDRPESEKLGTAVRLAKNQFQEWCRSYAKAAKEDRIKVWHHAGDALAFCYATNAHPKINEIAFPTSPWNAAKIKFNALFGYPGPGSFDIIDTSALADNVGLLNILTVASPLLGRTPATVLYAESLVEASTEPSEILPALLGCEVSWASLILGLAPTSHLLRISADMIGRKETFLQDPVSPSRKKLLKRHRVRMSWKAPTGGDRTFLEPLSGYPCRTEIGVNFEKAELSNIFMRIYKSMFAHEARKDASKLSKQQNSRYYTRPTLALLVSYAKTRTVTDNWPECVEELSKAIIEDKDYPPARHQLQEFALWLHMLGLHDSDCFAARISEHKNYASFRNDETSKKLLPIVLATLNPPRVVHIALIVPRCKINFLLQWVGEEKFPRPVQFHMVAGHDGDRKHEFHAISGFFGRMTRVDEGHWGSSIKRDALGWAGRSDLIVTCAIPGFLLLENHPTSFFVGLAATAVTSTPKRFRRARNRRIVVHQTDLADKRGLKLMRNPLGVRGPPEPGTCRVLRDAGVDKPWVNVEASDPMEFNIFKSEFKIPMAVPLGENEVSVPDASPCSIRVQCHTQSHLVQFPFAIDWNRCRIDGYQEDDVTTLTVKTPIASALTRGGYSSLRFPVTCNDSEGESNFFSWGFSHVNLRKTTKVGITKVGITKELPWLRDNLASSLSAEEGTVLRYLDTPYSKPMPEEFLALMDLKRIVNCIFSDYMDRIKTAQKTIMYLPVSQAGNDYDTLFIPDAIHYDANTGSVVMDAYIISPVPNTAEGQDAIHVPATKAGLLEWKKMIPALVERCRRGWTHEATCPYNFRSTPLSTENGQSPICACGQGKALDTFPTEARLHNLAKLATRVALSPVAAVPSVEKVHSTKEVTALDVLKLTCNSCGKVSKQLSACKGCYTAWYCNRGCQKSDWKKHKELCKSVSANQGSN